MDVLCVERDGFEISTDKARLDVDAIHEFLTQRSYWGAGRSLESTRKTIEHSLCFGVYEGARQVGFARVVTDFSFFGWVGDVFILETHRGKGLSKWLVETIVSNPELRNLKRLMLATKDAHELYRKYGGFQALETPEKWMCRTTGADPLKAR
jgi:GNAT superfamily N-acetyltransferase